MRREASRSAVVCFAVLGVLWLPGPAAAQTPIPPSVQAAIDETHSKPRYQHTTWGLRVVDRDTGEVLIDDLGEKLFVPGSIMKTFTTSAALAVYGPDYRFRTPVYRTGRVHGGRLDGDLVLVASGDFSFGLRERPDGTLGFNSTPEIDHNYADTGLPGPTLLADSHPLAGVNDLARQVRAFGVKRVDGDVLIDDRLFEEFTWPDGLLSPIWVNENVIDMQVTPSAPGEPAKLLWRPKTSAMRVVNRVRTAAAGADSSLKVDGPTDGGKITIGGKIAADSDPLLQIVHVPDPASFARTAMIDALRRRGIRVAADPTGPNTSDELPARRNLKPARRVAVRVSDPLSEYTRVILKVSYNRGADLMACLLAVRRGSTDCEDGLLSIVDNNAGLGAAPQTTFPFDGAGSDDRDRTSPVAATTFLANLAGQPYGQDIYTGLPIFGVDGTLRQTGLGSPAAGKIRAKTGNRVAFLGPGQGLAGAQTRIGYIDAASGRRLAYADMLRDVPLSEPTEIFDIDVDMTALETAIQQGY